MKKLRNLRDLWHNINWNAIYIIEVLEEEDREAAKMWSLNIMVVNLPSPEKEADIQIQELQESQQDKLQVNWH